MFPINFCLKVLPFTFCCLLIVKGECVYAQADSLSSSEVEIRVAGYLETYYVYDFNKQVGVQRQPFLFNHNSSNQVAVNQALISLEVLHPQYRGIVALQTGTYAEDNYAAEPVLLRQIFEAYAGLALDKKRQVWLDMGIFSSHIGFESPIAGDNLTLTRSIIAEHSPYFFSGARLSWDAGKRWHLAAFLLNGWQRIQRLDGMTTPSLGTQATYRASSRLLLNWSTYVGTDDPDSIRRVRVYNNFYGVYKLSENLMFKAAFDIGMQQVALGEPQQNFWYAPLVQAQIRLTSKWHLGLRGEYFYDPYQAVVPNVNGQPFEIWGYSVNFDYQPVAGVLWRTEIRQLNSYKRLFAQGSDWSRQNMFITTALSVAFGGGLHLKPNSPD